MTGTDVWYTMLGNGLNPGSVKLGNRCTVLGGAMKCATHPDVDAVGVCSNCGRAVCSACRTMVGGRTYCPICATGGLDIARSKHTGKPIAGGVLGIIAGVVGVFLGIIFIAGGTTVAYPWESVDWSEVGIGIALVILGVLAILGSSFAVARRNFTLSVIGGVSALLGIWPLGLPALILIAKSRNEFQAASPSLICPSCGRDNPRGSRFCMNCGRELRGSRPGL